MDISSLAQYNIANRVFSHDKARRDKGYLDIGLSFPALAKIVAMDGQWRS